MADLFYTTTILRSGRGIRLRHLSAREVREVEAQAAGKISDEQAKGAGMRFGLAFLDGLLLRSFSAVTKDEIPEVFVKDEAGIEKLDDDGTPILDVNAMLDSVDFDAHPEMWDEYTPKDLMKARGGIDEVLADPVEYTVIRGLVGEIHMGDRKAKGGALGKRVSSSGTR